MQQIAPMVFVVQGFSISVDEFRDFGVKVRTVITFCFSKEKHDHYVATIIGQHDQKWIGNTSNQLL